MIEEALTKRRLLDALEYIDDEYIASAARYKMKIKPHSDEPPVQTVGGSLKKYWKQYLGLVACLLLLSMATTIFNFVAQTINSIAGIWGDGTTECVTHTESPITTEYFAETENNTDIYSTTELHESVLTPNYLQFIPELEPISEEKMLEIRNAWAENRYEFWFDYYYKTYSYNMPEAEAIANADKEANIVAESSLYDWFVLSIYNDSASDAHKYRYYGQIGDYVVLVNYRTETYNYSDEILNKRIGEHTFFFQHGGEIYLYKDGVFETMKDVYEQGLITDEEVGIVAKRHKSGYELFYENWKKEEYSKYIAEKEKYNETK